MSLILSGTDGLSDVDGSAATPAIRGTDANTGIFFPAADTIAFSEGGVESMRIDSSGRVGIGTDTPLSKLEVNGGAANTYVRIVDTRATYPTYIGAEQGSTVFGRWGLAESMRIDSSGNVGIGVTPSAWNSGYKVIDLSTWGSIAVDFNTQGSTTVATNCFANSTGYDNWTFKNTAWATRYKQNDGIHSWLTSNASGTAGNAVTFAERMRIDTSGNLLVGSFTPYISERLTVRAASASVQCIVAYNGNNSQSAANIYSASVTASGSGWYHFIGQSGNGTGVTTNNIIIYGNGNVQNANNSYTGISDIKLKENVVDATPKLAKLMQVRVVNYNLKAEDGYEAHKQIGVIAQELEQIFPSMVEETADKDAKGEDLGTTTKSVKYSVFVPMLIKALQEQQAIITQLQADVASLQAPQGTP